jgi:hypothetical protein
VRLGGVGHVTAAELGGTALGLVTVADDMILMEAFEHLQVIRGV